MAGRKPQTRPSIQLPLLLDSVIELPLTQGKVALLDREDAELTVFNWFARKDKEQYYAGRTVYVNGVKQYTLHLHRVVMERVLGRELLPTELVDHWDNDGLNNRRGNLRLADHTQNQGNRRKNRNNSSGYKGVSWHKRVQKWLAKLDYQGKCIHIGVFDTPEEAHEAYKKKAIELWGEFARFD